MLGFKWPDLTPGPQASWEACSLVPGVALPLSSVYIRCYLDVFSFVNFCISCSCFFFSSSCSSFCLIPYAFLASNFLSFNFLVTLLCVFLYLPICPSISMRLSVCPPIHSSTHSSIFRVFASQFLFFLSSVFCTCLSLFLLSCFLR